MKRRHIVIVTLCSIPVLAYLAGGLDVFAGILLAEVIAMIFRKCSGRDQNQGPLVVSGR